MKYTNQQSVMPGILLCLIITLLFSCKKEKEIAVRQQVTEEESILKMSPVPSESPSFRDDNEESADRIFPKKASINANTLSIGTTDVVDFNDEMALTIIPDYAAFTFAAAPFYIQQVGTAWVHVKENNSGNYKAAFKSNYGHYHLSYQNFVPCVKQNGEFGKPSGGVCVNINPVKEPRKVDTHDGYQWIKIYAYDYSNPSRIFDLLGIKVTKGPIQLWFKKSNGDWNHWGSIGVGTWNLSTYCTSIKEVLIGSTGNNGPIGFDNVKVLMPYQ